MKLGALALLVILSILQMGCEEERPIFSTGNPPMAPLGTSSVVKVSESSRAVQVKSSMGVGVDEDVLRIGRAIAAAVR